MSVKAETDRGGRLSVTMLGDHGLTGDTLWMTSRQFSVLDRLWRLCDLADQFHAARPKSRQFRIAVQRLDSPGYPAEHSPLVAKIQKNSPTVVEIVVTAGTTGVAGLMGYFIRNTAALGAWYWEVRLSSEAARARYLNAKRMRLSEEREADKARTQLRRFVDQATEDLALVGPIELTSNGYAAEGKVNEMIEAQPRFRASDRPHFRALPTVTRTGRGVGDSPVVFQVQPRPVAAGSANVSLRACLRSTRPHLHRAVVESVLPPNFEDEINLLSCPQRAQASHLHGREARPAPSRRIGRVDDAATIIVAPRSNHSV